MGVFCEVRSLTRDAAVTKSVRERSTLVFFFFFYLR